MLIRRKPRKTKELTPFLITWEGSDYEEEVKKNGPDARCKIVAILSSRRRANELKVILSALFSAGYNFTLDEKVGHGLKQRFEEEELLSQPYPGKYRYGFTLHEFLFARAVRELTCKRNEKNHCECTLFWKELPALAAMPHLTSVPRDSFKYQRGADCMYRLLEDEMQYSYTYCPKFEATPG